MPPSTLRSLVRRGYPLLLIALVGLVAGAQAWGVTRVFGAALGRPGLAPEAVGPPAARPPPSWHETSAERVAARNPFDSVRGDLRPASEPPAGSEQEPGAPDMDPYRAPACVDLRVVATAAAADPRGSFAVLSLKEGQPGLVRRQGDGLAGGVVWFVGGDRVWMYRREGLCQAGLYGGPPSAASAPAARPPPAGPPAGPLQEIASRIRVVGPNEFSVERSALDRAKEGYGELMRGVRLSPESEGGRLAGVKIFGVKPESLLGILGLQNGDRLEKLNGFDMTAPEAMLQAYARLAAADHLTLSLTRGGKTIQIDAQVR